MVWLDNHHNIKKSACFTHGIPKYVDSIIRGNTLEIEITHGS